jgi:hypothetical protein
MAPTMKSKVHENRNESLHGWRKFEKYSCTSNLSARAQRTALQPFSQVKGFMMPVRKGFMTTPARLHRKLETLRGTNWHRPADAVRRSAGVAPSLAINGRCGKRLAPGDRRHAGAGVGLYVLARPMAVH